jgi:signal transduction histidine kinase
LRAGFLQEDSGTNRIPCSLRGKTPVLEQALSISRSCSYLQVELAHAMNRTIRIAFTLTTLALLVFYGYSLPPSRAAWSLLAALGLIYLAVIWLPEERWTWKSHVLSMCLVLGVVIPLHLSLPASAPPESLLLIPFVLLLAREQEERQRYLPVLAMISMVVMCILTPETAFLLSVMPVVIALYLSVRAINLYKAAYLLSQQNLEALHLAHAELERTHTALQEATLDSMRFAALAERSRLAKEIHDGLGHQLTSLIVQLQAMELMLPADPSRAATLVPELLEVARKAMAEVHMAVKTWRQDEGTGLAALQGLISQCAAHAPFRLTFTHETEGTSWSDPLSVTLYRILQEALTNILRHAGASSVTVNVREELEQVILTVSDDGGYTVKRSLLPGFGIRGMQERCQMVGGQFLLSPNQPHGLVITATLPLRSKSTAAASGPSERTKE